MKKAEYNKNYLLKLKAQPNYADYKKKKAVVMRKCRQKKKVIEDDMPLNLRKRLEDERRKAVRDRVRLCRQRKRLAQNETGMESVAPTAYASKQSLGKAVSKVNRVLPQSPRKRRTVGNCKAE